MKQHIDFSNIVAKYKELPKEQIREFFPGGVKQALKIIQVYSYIVNNECDYLTLLRAYIDTISRIVWFNQDNNKISAMITAKYKAFISDDKLVSFIASTRILYDNYKFLFAPQPSEKTESLIMDKSIVDICTDNANAMCNNTDAFGLSPEMPIYTHLTCGAYDYLNKLSATDGTPLIWKECEKLSDGVTTRFETYTPSGIKFGDLFINFFCEITCSICPIGYSSLELENPSSVISNSESEHSMFDDIREIDDFESFMNRYRK